jgi:hypothetical protein
LPSFDADEPIGPYVLERIDLPTRPEENHLVNGPPEASKAELLPASIEEGRMSIVRGAAKCGLEVRENYSLPALRS